jgi:TolB-like protein/class 3 adenylate cyclase
VNSVDREFQIADWLIDPLSGEIRQGAKVVKLEPKAMNLLVFLAAHSDQAVSREQILDDVWKGVIVGDDAVTSAIIKLRKAFDDDSRNPRFIQTIPKKGYRLIAAVRSPVATGTSNERKLERKLTAILYADVVEYSRLTAHDEEGTHLTLSSYLDQMSHAIEHHNGAVIHYAGDAVLAEFGTVVDALTCAVDIQRRFANLNLQKAADEVVKFRIGINLGDVIVDRDDIYGEGVNIAARLESLADPGGICISESVRSTAGNKLDLDYEFLGEQWVKNIDEPIRAYRVLLSRASQPGGRPAASGRNRRLALISIFAGLVICAIAIYWWLNQDRETLLKLPDRPSMAVMPFANTGGNSEDDYFSDGITDDLITDLSEISGLFVISRNSTFRYRNQSVDAREVSRALGVRYVLEGNVRRSGNQIRINSQLIDGKSGGQMWANRYDGSLDNVFELQDQVTDQIIKALELQLTEDEKAERAHFDTTSFEAYDEFLKGWEQYRRQSRESYFIAEQHFKKALELDPGYSQAHAALAFIYWRSAAKGWQLNQGSTTSGWAKARHELDQAMLNPTPLALSLLSSMSLYNHRYESAIESAKEAIRLNTNSSDGYLALANALVYAGEPSAAIDAARKAIRLDPHFTAPHLAILGLAQCELKNFHAAAETLNRSIAINPRDYFPYLTLISCYGQSDQPARAAPLIDQVETIFQREFGRGLTVDWWFRDSFPYKNRENRLRFLEGLKRAGVPES